MVNQDAAGSHLAPGAHPVAGRAFRGRPVRLPARSLSSGAVGFASALNAPGFVAITLRRLRLAGSHSAAPLNAAAKRV